MKARFLFSVLGIGVVLALSACGDQPSDSLTSTDVTCLRLMEAGGSCSSSTASSTVTVSSVTTVTATASSVTTVTTVGS